MRLTPAIFIALALLVGCDPAKDDFAECKALEAKDPEAALARCQSAVEKSSTSQSGKAAAALIPAIENTVAELKKKQAALEEAARAAEAKAQLERWRSLPRTLKEKIQTQGWRDLAKGTVTPALDVIVAEAGQPTGKYQDEMGLFSYYVWGTSLGDAPTGSQIKNAPFSITIIPKLACGDYGGSEIEFYSQGEQLRL